MPMAGAQAQQHAVVVELERQILGHHVVAFGPRPINAAAALQQDHHQLVPGNRQRQRVHVGTQPGEQLAVHGHHS